MMSQKKSAKKIGQKKSVSGFPLTGDKCLKEREENYAAADILLVSRSFAIGMT